MFDLFQGTGIKTGKIYTFLFLFAFVFIRKEVMDVNIQSISDFLKFIQKIPICLLFVIGDYSV